jgi:hypothetical protein
LVLSQVMLDGPLAKMRADCPAGTFFSVAVTVPRLLTRRDEEIVRVGGAGWATTREETVWVDTTRPL